MSSTTIVVTGPPGQTLWDVARQSAPGRAPDPVVSRIEQLNDLSGHLVHPGAVRSAPSTVR